MSFRNTAITQFIYANSLEEKLAEIEDVLDRFGRFTWVGKDGLGYFHGVIKDLNGYDTKNDEEKIIQEIFDATGVRVKIVIEE